MTSRIAHGIGSGISQFSHITTPPETPSLKLSKQIQNNVARRKASPRAPAEVWSDENHVIKKEDDNDHANLLQMARGARKRLEGFSQAPLPWSTSVTLYALFLVTQPLVALLPRRCSGFYAALARIGGDGRVRLLLKIAKMDEDHDGSISEHELKQLDKLVDNTCTSLTNFAVVGSLLFAANFLAVMDRPVWQPTGAATIFLGDTAPVALMGVAYALACCIATACLAIIIYSVASKYLLMYVHSTLEAKLCLLCELNPVGVCSRLFVSVVPLLVVLLPLGGMLGSGSGRWGLAALGVLPVAAAVIGPVFTQLRNGTLALHSEMMEFLERTASDVETGGRPRSLAGFQSLSTKSLSTKNLAGAGEAQPRQFTSRWPVQRAPTTAAAVRFADVTVADDVAVVVTDEVSHARAKGPKFAFDEPDEVVEDGAGEGDGGGDGGAGL